MLFRRESKKEECGRKREKKGRWEEKKGREETERLNIRMIDGRMRMIK